MKKKFLIIAILTALLLTACGSKDAETSDAFDEVEVEKIAKQAIEYFNNKEFDKLTEMGDENFKKALTDEMWQESYDKIIEQIGEFESLNDYEYKTGKQYKIEYALISYKAKHESKAIKYLVTVDKDLNLVGFLIQ